jgi:rare lipoprotein A
MTTFGSPGYSEEGIASYYGKGFAGRKTASGEIFRPHLLTAAHKKLPLGTKVKVEYGTKSVVVKINDRGPFIKGRIIDLSEKAAEVLGLKQKGIGRVKITVI